MIVFKFTPVTLPVNRGSWFTITLSLANNEYNILLGIFFHQGNWVIEYIKHLLPSFEYEIIINVNVSSINFLSVVHTQCMYNASKKLL